MTHKRLAVAFLALLVTFLVSHEALAGTPAAPQAPRSPRAPAAARAPESPDTPSSPSTPRTPRSPGSDVKKTSAKLPATGTDAARVGFAGTALLATGLALVLATRQRKVIATVHAETWDEFSMIGW